ncbi:MAG: chemotaxis protein CheC [Pseudomonadota bacterium]
MTYLSDVEQDALNELTNIGVSKAATALSHLVNEEITLDIPSVRITTQDDVMSLISQNMNDDIVAISEHFSGSFHGNGLLIFSKSSSVELVQCLLPEATPLENLTELEQDALTEVGNIILNACLGTYSNILSQDLRTELPILFNGNHAQLASSISNLSTLKQLVILLNVTFTIEKKNVKGYLIFLMDLNSEKSFLKYVKDYVEGIKS